MNLGEAEDTALEYFTQQGFQIEEWPFLDPSLEWRPRARVTRFRRGVTSVGAIVVRENCASFRDPHNWEPLVEARKKLPDLAIYFAVPESQNLEPLRTELVDLGVGLYVIRPDGHLARVCQDRVPFDDLVITYPIEPGKPYRNRQNVLKVLAHSNGFIWWLDKHFTAVGFDYLYEYLVNWPNRQPLNQIQILGSDRINDPDIAALRRRLAAFRREVANTGVSVEMRLITDRQTLRALHDRYIISADTAFNMLPTQSLGSGQQGSLTLEENPPDFQALWNAAAPL
jgi:hypothetical protein